MSQFKLSGTLIGHESDVRDVSVANDDTIISGSRDGSVRIWKVGRDVDGKFDSVDVESNIVFSSPTNAFVNAVGYVDDKQEPLAIGAGKDCIIYLSDLEPALKEGDEQTGKYHLIGHQSNICSVSYTEGLVISSSWDTTAKVWSLEDFSIKYDLKGHESSVWDAKFIDSETFLTCSADKTIRKWIGGKEVARYTGHSDVIRKLLILPGGKEFVSCSNDCTLKIWDIESGRVKKTLVGHDSFVYDIGVLPNGDLISTGEDRTVRIWRDGRIIQAITFPCISVWCVSVLPNGDFVTGGSDNILRIFTRSVSREASAQEIQAFKESIESSQIAEQGLDDLKKTDIPGYEALANPGKHEGATLMVKNSENVIEAHQWSSGEWVKIGDVVGSTGDSKQKQSFNGKEWDYLFDVDIEDGAPPLKLPYNANENPYTAAERFLAANELPNSYTEEVVKFIMKNTEGFKLEESQEKYENPYLPERTSESFESTPHQQPSLKVLPQETFMPFKDFKTDQLIKGLKKFNAEEKSKFTENQLNEIENNLILLNSKISLQLLSTVVSNILTNWDDQHKLIGYDFLRICIPRITTVDLIGSTEAPQLIHQFITDGFSSVSENSLVVFMMLMKVLSNITTSTLFIQLYIDPCDDGKYKFNAIFSDLLNKIAQGLSIFERSTATKNSKHMSSTNVSVATFIYNLSVLHLKTSLLKSSTKSEVPVAKFIEQVGENLIKGNSEAAYRLLIAIGNYKTLIKSLNFPSIAQYARKEYLDSFKEGRFSTLFNDLDQL